MVRLLGLGGSALLPLLTALVLLLVLPAPVSAVGRPPQLAPPATTDQAGVVVATHNTLHGRARFPAIGEVIGWQEVTEPADRYKMRRRLRGYDHFVADSSGGAAVPISFRADRWRLLAAGSVRVHRGVDGLTPARYVNSVVLRHDTGQRITFVNTHFINGAFKPWKHRYELRKRLWKRHHRTLVDTLSSLQGLGHPMFVVGDVNYTGTLELPGVVRAKQRGGAIDHIYVPQPSLALAAATVGDVTRPTARRLRHYGSDHPAWQAVYRLPLVAARQR